MATVSGQVRARKPAAKPAGKTTTKPAAKPAAKQPAQKTTSTAPKGRRTTTKPAATGNASKDVERAAKMTLDELLEIPTDERNDAQKARIRELKKERAFAKLRERAQEKKAQRAEDRTAEMSTITEEHPVGSERYLTRASYYGCKVRVEAFDEVRGRNLITVTVLTTKTGQDLDEDEQYTRRVSAKFLQEEKPTDKYKRGSRRPSEQHDEAEEAPAEDVEDEAELEDAEEAEDEDVADEEELEDEESDEDDSEDEDVAEDEDDSWGDEDEEE